MGKNWDELGGLVRGILRSPAAGVPLDVADDVVRAAEPSLAGLGGVEISPAGDFVNWRGVLDAMNTPDPRGWRQVERHLESDGFPEIYRENWPIYSGVSGEQATRSPRLQQELDGQLGIGPPVLNNIDIGPLDSAPDFELGSPLWHRLDKGYRANDNLRRGRTPNLRNQDPQLTRIAGQQINSANSAAKASRDVNAERSQGVREGLGELAAAAATVGIGAGLSSMYPPGETPARGDMTDTSGTEDLVAESRPSPSVEPSMPPEEQEFADRFKRQYLAREAKRNAPVDYSFQAREMIGKLNAMRREAGGEVPESKAMMAEINRLLELSNKQKNAPGYEPPMPTDYHGEAQRLLQKLNAHRMEVGGEVPETQQVMAEVRRLQALGDQQRNAR